MASKYDPLVGITTYLRPIPGLLGVEHVPIEQHPWFQQLCKMSVWQRERWVRMGNAWVDPDVISDSRENNK